jgi:hypothetical protein
MRVIDGITPEEGKHLLAELAAKYPLVGFRLLEVLRGKAGT